MLVTRVEVFERIRRDRRLDPQVSVRELARRYGVHRRTVRQALASATPPPRKPPVRSRPLVLGPAAAWIDEMLRADVAAPRKQRHTIERICRRLRVEYDFGEASYSTVRNYVNRRRPEIAAQAREKHRHLEGTVPQIHAPGEEAEVDFADVWVRLAGVPTKCHLFTLRLSYSGKAVHRVFASESQEAFMEGHIEAFRVLGGVPTKHIRYDNLKSAVSRVCFGRSRIESQRWVEFRSHYGFDAFYCLPGVDGAHEKGGVEHEGGRFRRAHLVPVPDVETLEELNQQLTEIDAAEDARHVHGSATSVGFDFAVEAEHLAPLPAEEFDCGVRLTPMVRKDSRIVVRQCYYSVPARLIGTQVRVSLRANQLLVFDHGQIVARHSRLTRRYDYRDDLDHYLEILLTKPGALSGSTALAQARKDGVFTTTHEAFWAAARAAHGDAQGTRALIEVLLLHRRMPAEAVLAGVTAALSAGSTSPDLVAIEARKAHREVGLDINTDTDVDLDTGTATGIGSGIDENINAASGELAATAGNGPVCQPAHEPAGEHGSDDDAVICLDVRRTAGQVPRDQRPLPRLDAYDQLLSRSSKGTA